MKTAWAVVPVTLGALLCGFGLRWDAVVGPNLDDSDVAIALGPASILLAVFGTCVGLVALLLRRADNQWAASTSFGLTVAAWTIVGLLTFVLACWFAYFTDDRARLLTMFG